MVDTVEGTRRTRNVIAERPGPPARRVAMVGAHLDSVREGPGINDNGSGVASTLALAERLRDRRGLRFGFWGAEELGLYGSRGYVASLSGPERRRLAGYVNLDMVGSPNAVRYVYGEGPVREALEQALRARRLAFDEIEIGASSDHAPFEDAGISAGGVYSGSEERKTARQARAYGGRAGRPLDPCYHRRCDTFDRVDQKVLARAGGRGRAGARGDRGSDHDARGRRLARVRGDAAAAEGHAGAPAPRRPGRRGAARARRRRGDRRERR